MDTSMNGRSPVAGSDEALRSWLAAELGIPADEVRSEARFKQDLDIDPYTLEEVIESLEAWLGTSLRVGPLALGPAASLTVGELSTAIFSALAEVRHPAGRGTSRHAS